MQSVRERPFVGGSDLEPHGWDCADDVAGTSDAPNVEDFGVRSEIDVPAAVEVTASRKA